MQQAYDFREESEALYTVMRDLAPADFAQTTQFNAWTLNDVLQHLHYFNTTADLSLTDEAAFQRQAKEMQAELATGIDLRTMTENILGDLKGPDLLQAWRDYYLEMTDRFAEADPKARLKWYGPDMSARSSITARLMETWSHGQEVFDVLGVDREEKDTIKNVAVIGNNTFGWTFINRGEEVPEVKPYLRLAAPSGEIWEFNDPSEDERIEGPAVDFCRVVAQTRNIQDVNLKVTGPVATRWMAVAQCFAGAPKDPPAPGTRFKAA